VKSTQNLPVIVLLHACFGPTFVFKLGRNV